MDRYDIAYRSWLLINLFSQKEDETNVTQDPGGDMFEPDKKVLLQLSMNLIKSYCYIYSGPIVQEGVHGIFVVVILIITYHYTSSSQALCVEDRTWEQVA